VLIEVTSDEMTPAVLELVDKGMLSIERIPDPVPEPPKSVSPVPVKPAVSTKEKK
jgi:hypothetical protein